MIEAFRSLIKCWMSSVVESLNQQLVQRAKELKLTQVTYHSCPRRDFAQRRNPEEAP